MLKLITFGQFTKPFPLKHTWNPGFSALRFNSNPPICNGVPPKKTGTDPIKCPPIKCGGDSSKGKSCGCGGTSSEKIFYCEGRNGRRRTGLFKKDALTLNYEVWPIIVIVSLEMIGICFMITWISQTRDTVKYFKKSKNYIESTDLLNPKIRKLWVEKQEYKPMKELHDLYQAMKEGPPPKKCKKTHCRFF